MMTPRAISSSFFDRAASRAFASMVKAVDFAADSFAKERGVDPLTFGMMVMLARRAGEGKVVQNLVRRNEG